MGNLISGSQSTSVRGGITDQDRAVLSLKAQRKKLEDQSKLLERRIDSNAVAARTLLLQRRRDAALLALKRKRLAENQLTSIGAYLINLETMLSDMEMTKQQAGVMKALKQGNEALKRAQQEMSLDDIQQLMDDTAEAKEYQDSVAAALSQQLDDADNEAVMSELAALEQQQLEDEVAALPVAPTAAAAAAVTAGTLPEEPEELPEVPRTRVHVPAGSDAIDEQERQLEPALVAA